MKVKRVNIEDKEIWAQRISMLAPEMEEDPKLLFLAQALPAWLLQINWQKGVMM